MLKNQLSVVNPHGELETLLVKQQNLCDELNILLYKLVESRQNYVCLYGVQK